MQKTINAVNIKTILYYGVYYLIAAILLVSGAAKIFDPLPVLETLKAVNILNEELRIVAATILPITEIGLAIMLVLKYRVKLSLLLIMILFGCFLAFSIYGTLSGLNSDCGCFGSIIKSEIGWGMVIRNIFLVSFTVLVFKYNGPMGDQSI